MRILHLLAPARFGGLERVVQGLAAGHKARGHEVLVAPVLEPLDAGAHPLVIALRAAGVAVEPLVLARRAYLAERRAVADLCRRFKPEIVHSHGYRPDVLDAPVARRLGLPTVSTVHGFTHGGWKNRVFEMLDRRALRHMAAVVAVSRALIRELESAGVPGDRLEYVANAWTMPASGPPLDRGAARDALGLPADAFVVGWVGRLGWEKGPDILLAALAQMPSPWMASIIGDGADRAALERQARDLGIASRLRWHGVIERADRLYGAFDVFALSSRTEGIPLVLFEAMAAGVPVVAARVGGVPEVLGEGEALLVDPLDPRALARAIADVQANPQAAGGRAERAARTLRERFGADGWLDRYEAVYERAATRRRAGTSSPGWSGA